ncbi:MAG: hypothetical protein ACYC2H_07275 [Thermoplasmatota archaeon]
MSELNEHVKQKLHAQAKLNAVMALQVAQRAILGASSHSVNPQAAEALRTAHKAVCEALERARLS